jgi:hypothetical protein
MNELQQSFKQLYILGKLLGVLPFSFDQRSKIFHRSLMAQLHTVVMLSLSTLAYPLVVSSFIIRVDKNFEIPVGSTVATNYRYVNFGMMLTLTLRLYHQKRIIKFLNSGLRIANALLQQTPESYGRKFFGLHLFNLF